MLLDIVVKDSTDRSVTLTIIDSADGTPETGVVYNTSGIALWYRREGAAVTAITEATLAALTTAHADGGFLHVSDGVYRLDLPDAAFATGANYVDVGGTVTGMIVIGGRVRLIDSNIETANMPANMISISGDTTAADNLETAFDDSAGAVPWLGIIDQGTAQSATSTTLQFRSAAAFVDDTPIGCIVLAFGSSQGYWQARTITDYNGTTDTATVPTWQVTPTGTITYKVIGTSSHVITVGSVTGSVGSVTSSVNVGQIAGQTANASAAVTFPTTVASTTNITAGTITTVTNLTNAPTSGDLTSTMKASVNTEVLDVLNTDTFAEPGQGTPAATTTIIGKIGYIYKAWRNKHDQDSSTYRLYNDDASTVDQKASVADSGTVLTRGEVATGP